MFIGYIRAGYDDNFAIYYKNSNGYKKWSEDTFTPYFDEIRVLDFRIVGKTYREKQGSLEELAKDWQTNFSTLAWSYSELAEIGNWFYKNAKRYGLLEEFKVNGIC